jgi:hypothetical protein
VALCTRYRNVEQVPHSTKQTAMFNCDITSGYDITSGKFLEDKKNLVVLHSELNTGLRIRRPTSYLLCYSTVYYLHIIST